MPNVKNPKTQLCTALSDLQATALTVPTTVNVTAVTNSQLQRLYHCYCMLSTSLCLLLCNTCVNAGGQESSMLFFKGHACGPGLEAQERSSRTINL